MSSIIKSVSITKEQDKYLSENPNISLSFLTQAAIEEYRKNEDISLMQKENAAVRARLAQVVAEMHKRIDFIEKRGLMNDFEAWDNVLEKKG